MRTVRLLVLIALVLSGTALSPLTVAQAAPRVVAPRVVDPSLVTRIVGRPLSLSTTGRATFSYRANRPHEATVPGVLFRCTLSGPGQSGTPSTCPVDARSGPQTTGRITYTRLLASRRAYKFTVQAFLPRRNGRPAEVVGRADSYLWRIFNVVARDRFLPSNGPSFNRPLSTTKRRVNLNRVIRTVDSMPGYKQAYPGLCPTDPAFSPGTIRVSLYSLFDRAFARALIRARKRCVSVQVLMNDHLDRHTDPSWRHLEDALGTRVFTPSRTVRPHFAHRCHRACRGGGVLHTKMYLFNSTLRDARRNRLRHVVMVGSSNMTSNAANIQYNDIFVQRGNVGLYNTFNRMFNLYRRDNGFHRNPGTTTNGVFQTTFWPQARGAADPYMRALRAVRCTGANGGTGIRGRSVVYVNMHAWFGTRGLGLADQLRRMYSRGCYVRVLYGFMSFGVFKKLRKGTGERMSVRRTLFSRDGVTAYVYSHLKNVNISGHVGRDRSTKLVYTGSNNFTNHGLTFDEVMVRIASGSVYNAYVKQFRYMSRRLSSATYANYSEPTGGGRAPRIAARISAAERAMGELAPPPGTPTIESDAIRVGADGRLQAVD
ncbi:MAG TPA: phospholipase D-like domain-containing protein [Nocardioidaceae bacterium]|nr:phospholipase D-like domain-containing protein [Nocardioidaceae bacterium]